MIVNDVVGKRVLATVKQGGYAAAAVEEYRVLEASPSSNYVRVMNQYGRKFWKPVTDIAVVEILHTLEPNPASKERA